MAYYFKHDDNARRDPKLIRLRRIKGMKGIGIYWCLIEIIHEQGGEIKNEEINSIAFELQEDENIVLSVLKEFDLFVIQPYGFGNTRVSDSLQERHTKSTIARNNVKNRWNKEIAVNQEDNTAVLPKSYNGNTIREDNRIEEDIFNSFRLRYPGTKRGNQTEFYNLCKKHKDWKLVNSILSQAIENQINSRNIKRQKGEFIPPWKNLSTWINNRCWEEETTVIEDKKITPIPASTIFET